MLTIALKDVDEIQKIAALNKLIENNRILLFSNAKGQTMYKY